MSRKPTYKELEQKIEQLVKEASERKRIEETLCESEERFRVLCESAASCVFFLENRVIKYVNQTTLDTFGYTEEEVLGRDTSFVHVSPEKFEEVSELMRQALPKDGSLHIEWPFRKKNGQTIWMDNYLTTMPSGDIAGILHDITDRKEAERALKESEERFRDTVAMLPSVIIEYGLDGILNYVNPHGYMLASYDPEDFEEGFHVLQLAAPEEHEKHYERIERMMQGENVPPAEYRLLSKDGKTFWGLVTSGLIKKDGEVVGVRTYTVDITERKEAEEALKERTIELELKKKSLEEINTAMKVLLKKREEDKIEIEDNVMTNVRELITPYFKKIKKTDLDDHQKTFLSIIESNMDEIISPFTRKLTLKYLKLTPTEIRIVNLIRQGNTTKNIAKILKVSHRTIDTHRKNIRGKIGLGNKKENLRTHLLACD